MNELSYVPIVMQFIDGVVTTSPISRVHRNYILSIMQEVSNNVGLFQALPQQNVITIPPSGVLKLKLLKLDAGREETMPINRYRVHYYSIDGELLDEQFWVIPNLNIPTRTITLHNPADGLGIGISLPNNLYEITRMIPEVEYSIVGNMLYFDNSVPEGEYTVEYQPGLSLFDIVYKK
jgi:hypothetical protein